MQADGPTKVAPMKIAVVGTGISGMSAAWLLSQRHEVTVYESAARIGGHSHTVDAVDVRGQSVPVDTGFIVYNEANYPNLTALFAHLGVPTKKAQMDFAVSLNDGALEYGSATPGAIFAQKRNVFSPRFWSMLRDLTRFYREAPLDQALKGDATRQSIGEYLQTGGYCSAFLEDHLFPQCAAIWSSSVGSIRDYPAAALVRFFENHGLLKIVGRPQWRTVDGGSRAYVKALTQAFADRIRLGCGVQKIRRADDGAYVTDTQGQVQLLCMPRVLGQAFNPLSLYFCHRKAGGLAAILYEVNNTFGERHAYLIPVKGGAGEIRQACDKAFYVSPFMPMALRYAFEVSPPGEDVRVAIQVSDTDGLLLNTAFAGRRAELTDRALLAAFFGAPLLALKVLAAIHWEGLRTWLKGSGFHRRPPPPEQPVTVVG